MFPQFSRLSLPQAARHALPATRGGACAGQQTTPVGPAGHDSLAHGPPMASSPVRACLRAAALACALLLLLPACGREGGPGRSPADPAATAPSDPPATAPAAAQNEKEAKPVDAPEKQSEQPPAPDAVMYFIYGKDGDGATSYEIENGSVATYWYGHQFDLGGKHYYAGFAYATPEQFGESGTGLPDPGARVALANATFVLSRPGEEKPWSVVGSEQWIGEFGGAEQADRVDASRPALEHVTRDGIYLLAVPTVSLQSGVDLSGYAIFRFQPGELEDVEDRHWRYLGTVPAGEDNAAACDGGEVMPCAKSTGTLAFVDGQGAMPDLAVTFEGTTIDGPDRTRTLGEQDRAVYRYDAAAGQYVAR